MSYQSTLEKCLSARILSATRNSFGTVLQLLHDKDALHCLQVRSNANFAAAGTNAQTARAGAESQLCSRLGSEGGFHWLSDWKTGNYDIIREYMKPIPR
jgi:hypothetical protein